MSEKLVTENVEVKKRKNRTNPLSEFYPKKAPSRRYILYVLERNFPDINFKISKDYLKNYRQFFYLYSEQRLSNIIHHNNLVKKITLESNDI